MSLFDRAKKGIAMRGWIASNEQRRKEDAEKNIDQALVSTFLQHLEQELTNIRVPGDIFQRVIATTVESAAEIEGIPSVQVRTRLEALLEKKGLRAQMEKRIEATYERTILAIQKMVEEVEGVPFSQDALEGQLDLARSTAVLDGIPEVWLEKRFRAYREEQERRFRSLSHQKELARLNIEQLRLALTVEDMARLLPRLDRISISELNSLDDEYRPLIEHLVSRGLVPESVKKVWKQLMCSLCLVKVNEQSIRRETNVQTYTELQRAVSEAKDENREVQRAYYALLRLPLEGRTQEQSEMIAVAKKAMRASARQLSIVQRTIHSYAEDAQYNPASVVESYFPNQAAVIIREAQIQAKAAVTTPDIKPLLAQTQLAAERRFNPSNNAAQMEAH